MSTKTGFFGRLGLGAHRGRWWVIAVTGLFAVLSVFWGLGVFQDVSDSGFEDPGSESSRAMDLIEDELGHADIDIIAVLRSDEIKVDNPTFAQAVQRISDDLPEDVREAALVAHSRLMAHLEHAAEHGPEQAGLGAQTLSRLMGIGEAMEVDLDELAARADAERDRLRTRLAEVVALSGAAVLRPTAGEVDLVAYHRMLPTIRMDQIDAAR